MDLEQLKKLLDDFKSKIETSISEKLQTQTDTTGEEIKTLNENLEKVTNSLTAVEENIKVNGKLKVPGLDEELKTNPFSWGAFAFAALNASHGMHEDKAWKGAEHEKEIIDEYAKIALPRPVTKDHIGGDGTQGGYLIPEEVTSEIIGMTIAQMPILEMGVTKLTGLYGDLPIPKQTERNTGYWVGETEPPTESTGAFDEITLRPKKAGAFTKYSKRLAHQTRGTADAIIKENVSDALALVIHQGFLRGTGTQSQPKGALTQTGYTVTPNLAANGARFRIDKAASMIQAIDVANELRMNGNYGFIMRPEVLGGMKRERIPQFTGQPIGQGMPLSMANILMTIEQLENTVGYKIRTTTQLLNNLTKGTTSTASNVIFGNWKQLFCGFWRDLEIRVSDQASDSSGNSSFLKDQFFMVAFQEVDCNVGRVTAFTVVDDAETAEANWTNG